MWNQINKLTVAIQTFSGSSSFAISTFIPGLICSIGIVTVRRWKKKVILIKINNNKIADKIIFVYNTSSITQLCQEKI